MYVKNDFKQVDLSDALKHVQESVFAITQTINDIKLRPEGAGNQRQPMYVGMGELLLSLDHVLQYIYYHAKSPNEVHDVMQTRDKVKLAYIELQRQISVRI